MSSNDRKFGADRVVIELIGCRGTTDDPLCVGKEYYAKVSQCSKSKNVVNQNKNCAVKSRMFSPIDNLCKIECPTFECTTDFRSDYFSLEVKRRQRVGDNTVIGTIIFPPAYFARCVDDQPVEEWFSLKTLSGDGKTAVKTCEVLVRLHVPGGFPKSAQSKSYRVQGVKMHRRKLRVSVLEAKVLRSSNPNQVFGELINNQRRESAPSVYASLYLDNEQHTKRNTSVAKPSFTPFFDETFEFFAECERCKMLTVKLKKSSGVFSQREVLGTVRIPLQFYLAQKGSSEVDDTFDVLSETDSSHVTARLHLKLEVRAREAEEKGMHFCRMESIKDDGFTDCQKRGAHQPRSLMEELGSVLVEDDDED